MSYFNKTAGKIQLEYDGTDIRSLNIGTEGEVVYY
jgi:hypothetical protein